LDFGDISPQRLAYARADVAYEITDARPKLEALDSKKTPKAEALDSKKTPKAEALDSKKTPKAEALDSKIRPKLMLDTKS
jgi:hypothetical protein